MNPSVDDRIASIVRALTDIILPALPAEAGLAKEQTQLAVGHLRILRAQFDAVPAFELEELNDARALATALLTDGETGCAISGALGGLRAALEAQTAHELPRVSRGRIEAAVDELFMRISVDSSPDYRIRAAEILVRMQTVRALKDRKWFAPMGFDTNVGE